LHAFFLREAVNKKTTSTIIRKQDDTSNLDKNTQGKGQLPQRGRARKRQALRA
jgi:hypothetical protein